MFIPERKQVGAFINIFDMRLILLVHFVIEIFGIFRINGLLLDPCICKDMLFPENTQTKKHSLRSRDESVAGETLSNGVHMY